TLGGTSVTITGSGFTSGQAPFTVTFGGVSATNVTQTDNTHLTATTPAHAAGAVDVVVTDKGGPSQAFTLNNGFTYNKQNQATLTVNGPATLTYGTTAALTASGGSGTGAVTFSAGASTGCSVTGDELSVTNASGTCAVTASKAGDNNYNGPVTSAAATVTLQKATPATLTV